MKLFFYDCAIWFLTHVWSRRLPLKFEIGIACYCLIQGLYNIVANTALNPNASNEYMNKGVLAIIFGVLIVVISAYHESYMIERNNYEKLRLYENNERQLERLENRLKEMNMHND